MATEQKNRVKETLRKLSCCWKQEEQDVKPKPPIEDDTLQPHSGPVFDIQSVCQGLAENDMSLITLDLSGHGLGIEEAHAIGNALRLNDNLCMLNLGDNQLGDEGASEIARGLQNHGSLEYLILSKNKISDAAEIATLLANVSELKWIDLSHNDLITASSVFEVAASHSNLEHVDLSVNRLEDADASALVGALEATKDINLFANQMGDETALAIGESGFGSVNKLNLGYNRIGNTGAQALAQALEKSHNLKELVLTGNPISSKEMRAVLELVDSTESES